MSALRYLWARHRLLLIAFMMASLVAAVMGGRAVVSALRWSEVERRDHPIADWMSPRYVARSWDVPPDVVAEALGVEPGSAKGKNIKELADESEIPVEVMIQAVIDAIATYRDAE